MWKSAPKVPAEIRVFLRVKFFHFFLIQPPGFGSGPGLLSNEGQFS